MYKLQYVFATHLEIFPNVMYIQHGLHIDVSLIKDELFIENVQKLMHAAIRGERKYLFAILDSETRYWIAKQVATHMGTDDVRPMFRKAKDIAGKVPSKLISDGISNFAEAHKDEYAPKNYLCKDSVYESRIRMDGNIHNNQMESFNCNTV